MRTLNCQVNLALSSLMVLGFATSESANAASLYSVTDLGTLSGSWSLATGINDSGQVIGYSNYFRAFFWENGVMTDLGTLGGTQSQAWGINDLGEVVGFADTNFVMNEYGHLYQQAFLWNKSQGMTDLGGPLGGSIGEQSLAYDINNSGQVVGGWLRLPSKEGRYAFLLQNGSITDLGTLGGWESRAFSINNSGQVVGESTFSKNDNENHAFIWNEGKGMTDLGTLNGGSLSAATAINDSGQVVGYSVTGGYRSTEAFLWEEGAGMISLGTLGGNHSDAQDINNLGQIVGLSSKTISSQDTYAFIWEGGVMTDLNSLIPDDSGWLLTEARDINNNGQIVGSGYIDNQLHAFLLTPTSEPKPVPEPASTWSLLAFGAFCAGKVLQRKQKKHQ